MKKYQKIILIVLIIIALIIFLYPKKAGFYYGAFIEYPEASQLINKEECDCFGFKYEKYGENPFEKIQCNDCGKTIFCVGIPYGHGKTCYKQDLLH